MGYITQQRKHENLINNKYKDDYKIGEKIKIDGRVWVIQSIKQDTKNIYHCIDKNGFKGSFHALEFKEIKDRRCKKWN